MSEWWRRCRQPFPGSLCDRFTAPEIRQLYPNDVEVAESSDGLPKWLKSDWSFWCSKVVKWLSETIFIKCGGQMGLKEQSNGFWWWFRSDISAFWPSQLVQHWCRFALSLGLLVFNHIWKVHHLTFFMHCLIELLNMTGYGLTFSFKISLCNWWWPKKYFNMTTTKL